MGLAAAPIRAATDWAAAARSLAPRLVQIETIGGVDTITNAESDAHTPTSDAPATGVLLDTHLRRDGKVFGEVVTSTYPLRHRPSGIIVRLSDGSSRAARLVATDATRMVSLLSIENPPPLPEVARSGDNSNNDNDEVRLGEAVAAVGLRAEDVYLTQGVVSGTRRLWGKAIQTDAAIGPANYGGLLIDSRQRTIGLIVPLALTETTLFAGSDFYDSGIGFAIAWRDVIDRIVPRLREGHDLHPSATGIAFLPTSVWLGSAVIASVERGSRSEKAGIASGDRIVSIDGHPVSRAIDAVFLLAGRYAEDDITITLQRDAANLDTTERTVVVPKRDP